MRAQVPPVGGALRPSEPREAAEWVETQGYHAARQELAKVFADLPTANERRDASFLLMQCAFEDQEYEEAYQWASEFLRTYPNDARRETARFIHGVSAFQTRRVDEATASLDAFIAAAPNHRKIGAAYFWRAMGKLDRGEQDAAENDLRHAYNESPSASYRDVALAGWALSLERRGAYDESIKLLEKFLTEFPESDLLSEVKIRLASLSLRQGNPSRAAALLPTASTTTRTEEEHALLTAESAMRLGRWDEARRDFDDFADRYSRSRFAERARYSSGWALIRKGDFRGAQDVFDSLGTVNDSTGYAALYEAGVLVLLQDRPNDAEARFEQLTDRAPYDPVAEKGYYQLGLSKYRARHYRDARLAFQLAARMFPESPNRAAAYRMLGETNVALGDFSNAEYDFAQVRRLGSSGDLLAPSMFQEGVCLYHLGRFKSSASLFTEYLRQFPNDRRAGEGTVWLGEALYQDYRFPEAERAYSDALRKYPSTSKNSAAAYGFAWTLFEQKKFAQAAAAFERFAHDYPGDSHRLDASLRKADCYFFMGQYDKASDLYASLSGEKTDSRTVEYAAFQVAMSYIQRGESERGLGDLREFLVKYPSSIFNEVVQFNIAWEYFSREQFALAIPEFRTLMRRYPDSQLMPRVLFNMGDSYYNLKQYDSSRAYYQSVIRNYPQSLLVSDALNGLQFTYAAEGKPAGALAEIDTLLRTKALQAPTEELLLRKGDILFGQGDFGGALMEYQHVLAAKPSPSVQARAYYQIGRTYELENNLPRAAASYRQAVNDVPDSNVSPQASLSLGSVLVKQKQYREAAAVFDGFERKYADSPLLSEVHYQHGIALAEGGDGDGAMRQFTVVMEKYPNDVFADRSRLRIALVLRDKKEFRAATDTLSGVMKRRSDDIAAEALVMIGETFLAAKKYPDALQAFNDVIRQFTEFPLMVDRARLGLGESYEKLREKKQAKAAYQELVKSGTDADMKKQAQDRLRKLR